MCLNNLSGNYWWIILILVVIFCCFNGEGNGNNRTDNCGC
jgi:hypothetical protein